MGQNSAGSEPQLTTNKALPQQSHARPGKPTVQQEKNLWDSKELRGTTKNYAYNQGMKRDDKALSRTSRDDGGLCGTSEDDTPKLRPQQQAFVNNYLDNGFNGTRAAIDAGYSKRSAAEQSSYLLRSPKVAQAIDKGLEDAGISRAKIKVALGEIAYENDLADTFDDITAGKSLKEIRANGGKTRLIKSMTRTEGKDGQTSFRVEHYSRLDALEKLAKVHNLLDTTMDSRGPVTVQGDVVVMLQQMIEGVAGSVPAGSQCFSAPAGALPGEVVDVEAEEVDE